MLCRHKILAGIIMVGIHLAQRIESDVGRRRGFTLLQDLLTLLDNRFKKTIRQFFSVLFQLMIRFNFSNFVLNRCASGKIYCSYYTANGNVICKVLPCPT